MGLRDKYIRPIVNAFAVDNEVTKSQFLTTSFGVFFLLEGDNC